MSHPIPLHTVDRLERALEATSRRVAARGVEGWVTRILALLFCRYAEAVIELIEGLLAEIRAGTIVLPAWAYDPPAAPGDESEPDDQRTTRPPPASADPAMASPRGPASRRVRAPRGVLANDPSGERSGAPERSAVPYGLLAPRQPGFTPAAPRLPRQLPEPAPRGLAGYPPGVPRWTIFEIGLGHAAPSHVVFITFSKQTRGARMGRVPVGAALAAERAVDQIVPVPRVMRRCSESRIKLILLC